MMNRRHLVLAIPAVALTGCTSAQIAQFQQDWSNFVDRVNALLRKGCGALPGFIATANTIEAVAGAFYPAASAAIAAGAAGVQAVASAICGMVPVAPPPVLAARLHRARLSGIPTVVGNVVIKDINGNVVINGRVIPIAGYGVR